MMGPALLKAGFVLVTAISFLAVNYTFKFALKKAENNNTKNIKK
jgi:hypothetical protein